MNDRFIFSYEGTTDPSENYIGIAATGGDHFIAVAEYGDSYKSVINEDVSVSTGEWHYVEIAVKEQDYARIWVDGIGPSEVELTTAWAGGTGGTIYIGRRSAGNSLDCYLDQLTIINVADPKVASSWSVFGEPIFDTRLAINGNVKRLGLISGVESTRLPDGNELVTASGVVSGDYWTLQHLHPTKGEWITNMNIPSSIGYGGFQPGGTFSLVPNNDMESKITWSSTRKFPLVVEHDRIITIDGSTDLCCFFWRGENDIAYKESTEENNISGTRTGGDYLSDGVQGKAFDNKGTDHIYFTVTSEDIITRANGAIIITFAPNALSNEWVLGIGSDSSNMLRIGIEALGRIVFGVIANGSSFDVETEYYEAMVGIFRTAHVFWKDLDTTSGFIGLAVDGVVVQTSDITQILSNSIWNTLYIGANRDGMSEADVLLDNVKIFSDCLLPYGATQHLLVQDDTGSSAHGAILSYVEGDETNGSSLTVSAGSRTIVVSGATQSTDVEGNSNSAILCDASDEQFSFTCIDGIDIDKDLGCISFWFKKIGTPSSYGRFFSHSAGTDEFCFARNASDTSLIFNVNNVAGVFSNVENVFDGRWHYLQVTWDSVNNSRKLWIDGSFRSEVTTEFTPHALSSGSLWIGNRASDGERWLNGAICNFTIINQADPKVAVSWSVFGKPLYTPLLEVT